MEVAGGSFSSNLLQYYAGLGIQFPTSVLYVGGEVFHERDSS